MKNGTMLPPTGNVIINAMILVTKPSNTEPVDIETYLEVNLEKPLKSVSYYLLAQLQDMSRRLLLPVEQYKKQDLYHSIKQVLVKLYKIES